jgi:hypothetical protein
MIYRLNMSLSESYNKSCLNSAPTNKSPAEAEPEPEPAPEIEPEPFLASNSDEIPALGEVYVPLIPADGIINEVPTGKWYNPAAKRWARSECNDSCAAEKPGPHDTDDEFLLDHIYSHEVHDGKILYSCRWLGWPASYDTLEPEENIFDSRAFYKYALASLNVNIGSKRKLTARRTGASKYASKKLKTKVGMNISLKLNLREPRNEHESIMYELLKRNYNDQKYSEATGFYR